ncbi:HlyIII-domain-containing protein [Laetiporus sulphureus 93-53]|uniref:HlyIII-domain-containing protein n=1 Tax=Laetiporus sulphureus 93-53 TaxID=1314785 RepID=A0A165CZF7_9APHY|nr:HlyIII-domain-containing protein [Laetiporus sulphureus 93-53]KZT03812.1 HlyIII-domain-containing protein [Laetiporus sulphureus 93-53]
MAQMDSSLRARHDRELNEADPSVIPTASEPEQDVTTISHDRLTLTWLEIPAWQRDNDYILTGYRRAQYSWRGCAYSIFGYLHNETVNIQTHLFGAVLFAVLLSTFQPVYFIHYESTNWLDFTVFTIFLTAAVFCLLSSSFYHTFSVHSKEVSLRCHAVDYAGIVVLTVGSFFPCIYYEFYCDTALQMLYLSLIVLVGTGAAYIVLNPEYTKPSHRGARTKVFIALGLSAIFPVGHGFVTHGLQKLWSEMGFGWLIASGLLYIAGALLYANRVPERFSPGTFDHFFASHQIFHVCVVLAALAHYACVLTAFDHAHSRIGYCSS